MVGFLLSVSLVLIIICVVGLTAGQKLARSEKKRQMKRDLEIYRELQAEAANRK